MLKRTPPPVTLGQFEAQGTAYGLAAATFPNGRLAVYITRGLGGALYCRWSVNIPELNIGKLQTFVKTYDENESFREPLLASGFFEDTGIRTEGGFVEMELWQLSPTAAALVQPLLDASSV
jgi:hypothetical protein